MHPIPNTALDDRLGIVGTAGSGKTYGAGTAVERILARKGRVVIPDPLGVWWGLRLAVDGKTASPFSVVIFGGEHGDLPLTEHAGALIGETVAGMQESAIIDLSGLGTKAAERRFMLAFLTALYKHASKDPVHIVFDEADMWAPQQPRDREGDAIKLLGMMETIVRRGRVRGFIPWLITQRPAVVNKDVLSQIDGLAAFKLTSPQDRDALSAWVEGQADRKEWHRIYAELATKGQGEAIVWLPARGVLSEATFPPKATFDSSRTPKRGEAKQTAELKPLDLSSLKSKLATVEAEVKANDPRALKAEIARLKRELSAKTGQLPAQDPKAIEEAERHGEERGWNAGVEATRQAFIPKGRALSAALDDLLTTVVPFKKSALTYKSTPARPAPKTNGAHSPRPMAPRPAQPPQPPPDGLSGPQMKVIEAMAFWRSLDFLTPTRAQVGAAAGYSPSSGGFNNLLGSLRTLGLIDYPAPGTITLTETGTSIAPEPAAMPARDRLNAVLSGPQAKIVDALSDGEIASREELGERTGYSASSGGFNNLLGSLRTLGIIDYPSKGQVAIEPWVFG